jgi:hypothetical protein
MDKYYNRLLKKCTPQCTDLQTDFILTEIPLCPENI